MRVWAIVRDSEWAKSYASLRDMDIIERQVLTQYDQEADESFVVLDLAPGFTPEELETDSAVLESEQLIPGDNPITLGIWQAPSDSFVERLNKLAIEGRQSMSDALAIPGEIRKGAESAGYAFALAALAAGGIYFLLTRKRGRA